MGATIEKLKSETYKGITIYFEKDVNEQWVFAGAGKINPDDGKSEFYIERETKLEASKEIRRQIDEKSGAITYDDYFAGEILKQLGGNRFIAMTGAKNFVRDNKRRQISFKIGRNAKRINGVRIRLNSMDTYDIQFLRLKKFDVEIISEEKNVYNDQLQSIFTKHTGLYTSL